MSGGRTRHTLFSTRTGPDGDRQVTVNINGRLLAFLASAAFMLSALVGLGVGVGWLLAQRAIG